ncbi:MAG: hypothetical protein ACLVIU_12800 [Paraclostridium sp.]|uniref:Uncharacterized protein n=1 Tax=Paeniclostridium hominis TaxID=2764329 RepID=A0ABR7K2S9_9FIRM|nr:MULTISPECIES: hypothetical protein [Paeniclostridium]MBC6003390.1 hypothetical protein [Paeniclostridium hominis]
MSKGNQVDMIEITYKDGKKIKIHDISCENFDKAKQWVEDFNKGLKVEDLVVDNKDNTFLRQSEIELAIFNKAQARIFW